MQNLGLAEKLRYLASARESRGRLTRQDWKVDDSESRSTFQVEIEEVRAPGGRVHRVNELVRGGEYISRFGSDQDFCQRL